MTFYALNLYSSLNCFHEIVILPFPSPRLLCCFHSILWTQILSPTFYLFGEYVQQKLDTDVDKRKHTPLMKTKANSIIYTCRLSIFSRNEY